ncbi:SRP40, C-terminal domain-containing protein [Xylariales sp. AK1849]|nr:SRP40, C-terminal domain-containing protein [Xylariales sp. AK1849]
MSYSVEKIIELLQSPYGLKQWAAKLEKLKRLLLPRSENMSSIYKVTINATTYLPGIEVPQAWRSHGPFIVKPTSVPTYKPHPGLAPLSGENCPLAEKVLDRSPPILFPLAATAKLMFGHSQESSINTTTASGPPSWLFTNNSSTNSTNHSTATTKTSTMAKKVKKSTKNAPAAVVPAVAAVTTSNTAMPPSQLMDLVESFLSDQGFDHAHREFKKHRADKGWKAKNVKKQKKEHHSLVSVFQTWETFASTDNTPLILKSEAMEVTKVSSSSDSDSDSDASEDVDMADAPVVEPTSVDTSSSSSSSSSSDGDSDSEDEMAAVKAPAKSNPLKRKDRDSSSSADSDEDTSDSSSSSSSDDEKPQVKKVKIVAAVSLDGDSSSSSSSDSSDSDSSEDETAAKPAKVTKTAKVAADDSSLSSSSDSSSSSESESDSDSDSESEAEAAAKVPLPESSSSSSSSSSDSDSESESEKPKKAPKKQAATGTGSDTSATLEKTSPEFFPVSKFAPLPPDPVQNNRGKGGVKKAQNMPFSRIKKDIVVDPRLASNAYVEHGYGQRAHEDLIVTKGKGFTKEKNKKKRGAYKGGPLDVNVTRSIKFDD